MNLEINDALIPGTKLKKSDMGNVTGMEFLSKVFFIATANSIDSIPGPLRDRMEIINVPGYTALEKREIAKRYLVPRQIKECGLKKDQLSFRVAGIDNIIKFYTMESGVRELERVISRVCRKVAKNIVINFVIQITYQ